MRKAYRHNGPSVCMSLGSGRSLPPGASAEIDVESTPEWSAARKWLALGWLVPIVEPEQPERDTQCDEDEDGSGDVPDMSEEEWLTAHTVAELRDLAELRGVDLPSRCRKSEIIARLTDGRS